MNVETYFKVECDDPRRPSYIETDVFIDLDDIGRLKYIVNELNGLKCNYTLLTETFDSSTDRILDRTYLREENDLNQGISTN